MIDPLRSRRLWLVYASSRPGAASWSRVSGLTVAALLVTGLVTVGPLVAPRPIGAASVWAPVAGPVPAGVHAGGAPGPGLPSDPRAGPAAAPSGPQVASLDRVDSLATVGDVSRARETLTEWWDARFEGAPPRDRQRALWLRGTLTVDPDMARRDYLRLVLEYPGGPHSAAALLRLGQAEHAAGRIVEAARHYEQLLRDYPDDPLRLEARRWLDENRETVVRARATPPSDREEPPPVAAGTPSDEPPAPAPEDAEPTRVAPDAGPVSLQLGAFSSEERAREVIRRAREGGIDDLRIVRVGESSLIRVRAGRYASRDDAAASRARVERAGFDSVVVTDADAERPVP